jgi:outer membrane protein assembly factor BamD (BamD/ComL family)
MITLVAAAGCAPIQERIAGLRAHRQLEQYRENLADGFFESVIQQSEDVIGENGTGPAAEVAYYALGEVYAHPDFEERDYKLSRYYFEQLIVNFPESNLTSEARTYISLFETIEAREKEMAAAAGESEPDFEAGPSEQRPENGTGTEPRKIVEDRNFEEAVRRNLEILEKVGRKKPADEALYNLGLIYAHADNPAKDYQKSQIYFHVLTKQFPDSDYAEEASVWLGLFETIEKMQQIDIEIEQQKKQLTR